MSGFVAILHYDGSPVDTRVLRRLTDSLAFRGPDAQEVWSTGPVGLGHTLLRITREGDEDQQPLSLDGKSWIVADSRVDARKELLSSLSHESVGRQAACPDSPDAEFVLRAYMKWGENCVEHLVGDFSFVIWDQTLQRVFAARDHFGLRTLFYAQAGGVLILSNTLDCIRRHPGVSDRLDDLSIADFLVHDMIMDPGASSFADIRRLPPAHVLTCAQGNVSVRRYWKLPAAKPVHFRRQADYVEHFRELLDASVAERLRADSAGVLMSGGLDSPTIAASARRVFSSRGTASGLRAYTDVYDRLIPHEERRYATLVADALQIPIEFRVGDDSRIFEFAERHTPEPVHSAWPDPTVSQLLQMAPNSRVALTGLGADPLLSSLLSDHFRRLLRKKQFGRALADGVRYLTTEGRLSRLYIRKRFRRWFPAKTENSWYPEWLNPDLETRLHLRERWDELSHASVPNDSVRPVAYEQTAASFWADVFEDYDPGETQCPVQVSHPFFDLRLVDFLLALPTVPWCCDKELLREAARGELPDAVRLRRKSPMPAEPLVALLQKAESAWVDRFTAVPELERYVLRQRIPRVFKAKGSWLAWMHLRPLSLNFWLSKESERATRRL